MTQPAETTPQISNPDFRKAVELVDAGDVELLGEWIESHPELLKETADEDGTFAGDYFANPRLLWFVAENPIRNGTLPANIAAVTQVLIDLARKHDVDDLDQQLDYTLSLVTSGMVPRECGLQGELVQTLVAAGANADGAIVPALTHRELDACHALLASGARLTFPLAAGLGMIEQVRRLLPDADAGTIQQALIMAAINGQPDVTQLLVEAGGDVNRYNPPGMHAHTTPLHQAIDSGSLATVQALVDGGADITLKDKIFDGHACDWAEHCEQREILDFLRGCR